MHGKKERGRKKGGGEAARVLAVDGGGERVGKQPLVPQALHRGCAVAVEQRHLLEEEAQTANLR